MTWSPDQLPPDIIEALRSGNKIAALKAFRKLSGLGLAEAKAVIDEMVKRNTDLAKAAKVLKTRSPEPRGETRASQDASHTFAPAEAVHRASGLGPGEVPRSNATLYLVVLLIIAAVALYYFSN